MEIVHNIIHTWLLTKQDIMDEDIVKQDITIEIANNKLKVPKMSGNLRTEKLLQLKRSLIQNTNHR